MVEIEIKNLREIESETLKQQFIKLCNRKKEKLDKYFKKYKKPLVFQIVVNKDGNIYKTSASLNMKSKDILVFEEGDKLMYVTNKLLKEFIKSVKRQKELERKDYLYKKKSRK